MVIYLVAVVVVQQIDLVVDVGLAMAGRKEARIAVVGYGRTQEGE